MNSDSRFSILDAWCSMLVVFRRLSEGDIEMGHDFVKQSQFGSDHRSRDTLGESTIRSESVHFTPRIHINFYMFDQFRTISRRLSPKNLKSNGKTIPEGAWFRKTNPIDDKLKIATSSTGHLTALRASLWHLWLLRAFVPSWLIGKTKPISFRVRALQGL